MPLTLDEKKSIVTDVHSTADTALSLVIADARGVSVSEITKLRADARLINVRICIVRNTLAKRAFEGTDFVCLRYMLVFRADANLKSHLYFRIFNEIPVLFLVSIVILAIVRPFQ